MKMKKSDSRIEFRLPKNEKIILEERAEERGISVSTYIREQVFREDRLNLYDSKVKERLFSISEILAEEIERYCTDEKFIEKCRNEANELWRYLR